MLAENLEIELLPLTRVILQELLTLVFVQVHLMSSYLFVYLSLIQAHVIIQTLNSLISRLDQYSVAQEIFC